MFTGNVDKLAANDPGRLIDWRWQRALVRTYSPHCVLPGRDDRLTKRGLQFLRLSGDSCFDPAPSARTMCPEVFEAWYLNANGGDLVYSIESRLLAGQPIEAIARHFGRDQAIIEAYEGLFFNVCDRRSRREWIVEQAVQKNTGYKEYPERRAVFFRRFGYFGGLAALEAIFSEMRAVFNLDCGSQETSSVLGCRRVFLHVLIQLHCSGWPLFENALAIMNPDEMAHERTKLGWMEQAGLFEVLDECLAELKRDERPVEVPARIPVPFPRPRPKWDPHRRRG